MRNYRSKGETAVSFVRERVFNHISYINHRKQVNEWRNKFEGIEGVFLPTKK